MLIKIKKACKWVIADLFGENLSAFISFQKEKR